MLDWRILMLYLIDTNVLSEPLRERPDPGVIARLDEFEGLTSISSIVWSESLFGVFRMPRGRRQEQYLAFLEEQVRVRFPILPFDHSAAHWLAVRRASLEAVGRLPTFVDGMIAATAAVNNLTLVTRNLRHFAGFPGLRLESWHTPT
ncbi:type II toxin-antitoxin system VapC family toxin [Rhodothermus sp. AH-315-K08]|nr:type II toxin-antitoxin system VapC family toxin [Rhodothermus sp. AH-315-K08]